MAQPRFEITHENSTARDVLMVLFWLWGIGAGALTLLDVVNAIQMKSLGVGTSSANAMMLLAWIGGMLLFGIGALLAGQKSVMRSLD